MQFSNSGGVRCARPPATLFNPCGIFVALAFAVGCQPNEITRIASEHQLQDVVDRSIKTPVIDSNGPEVIWAIPVGTGYGSPVVFENRVVFNHRVGDEDIVQCVDTATGSPIWAYRSLNTFLCKFEYSSGPYSTPLIHENRVYCVGGEGELACLDLASGALRWKRELHQDFDVPNELFPVGSSPLIVAGKVIFNVGSTNNDAGIVAFNAVTGATEWQATDHGVAYCTPVATQIHGLPFLFVTTKVGLVSLHPETGAVDWELEHFSRSPMTYNAVSPLVHGDCVLTVAGPGPGAVCLQLLPDRSYRELWRDRKVLDSQFNGLMYSDGCVFGFTSAGQRGAEFRCVELLTGKLKWSYPSVLRRGQGLLVGDAIVLTGEAGHLTLLKRSTNEPRVLYSSTTPLFEAPCYCTPAICEHGLLVKNEEQLRLIRCWSEEHH